MSNSNPSFVNDLVEMAKAFEALPRVQAELSDTRGQLSSAQDTIASRETSILSLKQQLEAMQAQLRKVEAERDDAMSAFLEADDRVSAFKRLVAGFSTDAQALVKADEPKHEVTTEERPEQPPQGQSAESPSTPATAEETAPSPSSANVDASGDKGQSAEDPTLTNTSPQGFSDHGATPLATVTEGQSAPTPTDATPSKAPDPEGGSVTPTAHSSADVGSPISEVPSYANEPAKFTPGGFISLDWYRWEDRMNDFYGKGLWPSRPDVAIAQ